MLTFIRPFAPKHENSSTTQNLAVGTVAASINVTPAPTIGTSSVRIVNNGSQVVFVKMVSSKSTGVATVANSFPLLPNTVETFLVQNDVTAISFIASATGSTVYATFGDGA